MSTLSIRQPWCVLDYSVSPYALRCTRCQESLPVALPIRVSIMAALCRAFAKAHRHCKETNALPPHPPAA